MIGQISKVNKHLEFKGKFRNMILSGEKKTTLRLYTNLKEGDLVYIHCGGKIIGIAEIKKVTKKSITDIRDRDVIFDGFKNKKELLEELKRLYDRDLLDSVYIIEFKLISKINKDPYEVYYENTDLIKIAEKALKYIDLNEEDREILELFLRLRSVRKVAFKLGGLKNRGLVRKILRESFKKLKQRNLI